jgi:hypothetical protein
MVFIFFDENSTLQFFDRGEHGSDWGGYHGYPKPDPQCSGLLKGTRNPHFFSLIRWVAGLRGGAGIYPIDRIRSIGSI